MTLSGPVFKPRSGSQPKSAVIFLHGLGSDGENLIGLADYMADKLPDTVFHSPNAPFKFDMFEQGYQWFSLTDRDPAKMLTGVQKAAPLLDKYIDEILSQYGLDESKLALVGFSQGTMTALHTAVRREKKIAGIVGFSGSLIAAELLATEARVKPDICLIHGDADDVVPHAALAHGERAFIKHGFYVEAHTRPFLPHSIDLGGIEIAVKFLEKRL